MSNSCLKNLSNSILWEFYALQSLLKALLSLEEHEFYEALLNINKANGVLETWEIFIKDNHENSCANEQLLMNKNTSSISGGRGFFESFWYRKGNIGSSPTKQNDSEKPGPTIGSSLFRWLLKLKDVVVSKFSFYYFNQLSTQVSSIETMRMIYDENISKLKNGMNFL